MKLRITQFAPFDQVKDIKADIKGGWCAGVTAMVGAAVGAYDVEGQPDFGHWVEHVAFVRAKAALLKINSSLNTAETLQAVLGRYQTTRDVCGDLHKPEYEARGCKVLLSLSGWFPVLGYASYLKNSKWLTNHIGYIIRGGDKLVLFDPNYGIGLFTIEDALPLNLNELTKAIGILAWKSGLSSYLLSYTAAISVVDEDPLQLRLSNDTEQKARALRELSGRFFTGTK
ncbi:hypothetical protein [Pseudomonas fluorescens]|uniref:hypothetical protein n=1 Tax=Pseudomonas fluorescens TaxID=294 RepID=UPI0027841E20|nr:hypothetical protein [Pseudomonas fluorescens]MDP9785156.1 hypothetical protein [Pseudomonas fluorescens]